MYLAACRQLRHLRLMYCCQDGRGRGQADEDVRTQDYCVTVCGRALGMTSQECNASQEVNEVLLREVRNSGSGTFSLAGVRREIL